MDLLAARALISAVAEGPFGCRVWLGALSQGGGPVWDPDAQRSVPVLPVLPVLWEDRWRPIPVG